jgi:hypothetical protein
MTLLAAKVIWLLGVVGWFIIRYPTTAARAAPRSCAAPIAAARSC